jgi:hypothetical protein
MLWHEQWPERWKTEQQIAKELLDDFVSGVDVNGVAFFEGTFHVRSEHGHTYESVKIRVEYPSSFPNRGKPPKVLLTSHRDRWKKGGDAHINSDWSLCLFVPGESRIDFNGDDSLRTLFGVMQTFLIKEYFYQRALEQQAITGKKAVWLGEARSHGMAGIAEAVREQRRVGRNAPCPCGSGKKFKFCCMRQIWR